MEALDKKKGSLNHLSMISNLGIPSDANDPFSSKVKDEFVLSLTAKSTKELAGPQSQPKH